MFIFELKTGEKIAATWIWYMVHYEEVSAIFTM
jgi:hypothetical protein